MSSNVWSDTTHGSLRSHWWLAVLRGIVAVLFGISVFARPGLTLGVFLLMFGAFALVSGVIAIISAIGLAAHHKQWWALLIEGVIGVIVGMLTLVLPAVALITVARLIAIWAIMVGAFQLIASLSRFGPSGSRWLLGIGGLLSIALGILILTAPIIGMVTIVWFLGIYLLLFGIDQIILGFQLRHLDAWINARAHPAGV